MFNFKASKKMKRNKTDVGRDPVPHISPTFIKNSLSIAGNPGCHESRTENTQQQIYRKE